MEKITDYRTEAQKRRAALHSAMCARYVELLEEGLTKTRARAIVSQEFGRSTHSVLQITKRFEEESANQIAN